MGYGAGWKELAAACKRRDNYTCRKCGWTAKRSERYRLQADHILPRLKGGADALHNLQTLCLDCHRDKTVFGKAARQQQQVERLFHATAHSPRYTRPGRRPGPRGVPIFGY